MRRALRSTHTPGLVLSTGQATDSERQIAEGVVVCPIEEVLVTLGGNPVLDTPTLYRMVTGQFVPGDTARRLVTFDSHRKTLFIAGKPPWQLKGSKQSRAIKYLADQFHKGNTEPSGDQILDAAGVVRVPGRSRSLRRLFNDNPYFDQYVENHVFSKYRLKLD